MINLQMAAGWHHSCLLNNYGTLYTWGLNFDGQLGQYFYENSHL